MSDWIHKSEALKKADVSAFDAKRYLSIFSQFIPFSGPLVQGSMVSPCVPEILMNFKTLEKNGLSTEQIIQTITQDITRGKRTARSPVTRPEGDSVQAEASIVPILFDLIKQLADNQQNIQAEVVELLQYFEKRINLLNKRIEEMEKASAKPE